MNENEQNQNREEVRDCINDHHDRKSYLKRIHHSWIFWIFLALMFVAIFYYIISIDFTLAP